MICFKAISKCLASLIIMLNFTAGLPDDFIQALEKVCIHDQLLPLDNVITDMAKTC